MSYHPTTTTTTLVVAALNDDNDDDWNDWHDFASLFVVAILSALTIYRKQWSSNRCFHQDDDDYVGGDDCGGSSREREEESKTQELLEQKQQQQQKQISDLLEREAEELLDGAGLTFSGAPILSLASQLLETFLTASVMRGDYYYCCCSSSSTTTTTAATTRSKLPLLRNSQEQDDDAIMTSDLLEKAGNYYYSAELVAAIVLFFLNNNGTKKKQRKDEDKGSSSSSSSSTITTRTTRRSLLEQNTKEQTTVVATTPTTTTGVFHNHQHNHHHHQEEEEEEDQFTNIFPPDVHVHIISFLHPRDVISLACVSKSYNELIDDSSSSSLSTSLSSSTSSSNSSCCSSSSNEVSRTIWKTLWQRDYAWAVCDWQVGRDALKRSGFTVPEEGKDYDNDDDDDDDEGEQKEVEGLSSRSLSFWEVIQSVVIDKEFYFVFGQTYLNWIIAGQNTVERCLVGLHCNVYDITTFLDTHPGSPDTLMVYSGKDSTSVFEDLGHSLGARRMAKSLCVVMESSDKDNWGILPTFQTQQQSAAVGYSSKNRTMMQQKLDRIQQQQRQQQQQKGENSNSNQHNNINNNNLLLGRKQRRRVGTLQVVRDYLEREHVKVKKQVGRGKYSKDSSILGGQVNIYYDPFRKEWRIWYTNSNNLENVYEPVF